MPTNSKEAAITRDTDGQRTLRFKVYFLILRVAAVLLFLVHMLKSGLGDPQIGHERAPSAASSAVITGE